jgi:hypothetical protein
MIRCRPAGALVAVFAFAFAPAVASAEDTWPTYRGAWFEIDYPPDFSVSPSLESPSMPGERDSAFFDAPDGNASFYVYSPQWGGDPVDIRLDADAETLASESESKKGDITVRWYTITAKDGSYSRSYQDRQDDLSGVRTVIGFRFRDGQARERHRAEYERFKASLRPFAD